MDVKGKLSTEPAAVRFTADLSAAEHAALLEVARVAGCTAVRGPRAGGPSIIVMLRDIAAGDVVVTRLGRTPARQTVRERILALREGAPQMKAGEAARIIGCPEQTVRSVWSSADRLEKGARDGAGS